MKALCLLPLLAAGCVTGSYERAAVDDPVTEDRVATLRPGTDTLASCLAALGAPHRVFEYRAAPDGTAGMALLWSWRDAVGWGVDVSSGDDSVPGNLSFDALSAERTGCMLWFRADLVLERWRRGPVGDLVPTRRRPSAAGE